MNAAAVHPRVAVNGVCSAGWTLGQELAFYRDAGIDHVSIALNKVEAAGWDAGLAAIGDAGVRVATVLYSAAFHLDRPEGWPAEQAGLIRAVDATARIGGGSLYMTAGPPGRLDSDEACVAFAEALAPVRGYADAAGVPLAVEHNHALRRDIGFLHTLTDMVEYAEELDVGIVVELNNCWIERRLPQLFRRGAPRFRVVQVSDFAVGTLETPNRLVPGDGDIPLERLLGLLLEAGYAGPFDLEFLGPRIEAEGYASAIRRGVAWLSEVLTRLGA